MGESGKLPEGRRFPGAGVGALVVFSCGFKNLAFRPPFEIAFQVLRSPRSPATGNSFLEALEASAERVRA